MSNTSALVSDVFVSNDTMYQYVCCIVCPASSNRCTHFLRQPLVPLKAALCIGYTLLLFVGVFGNVWVARVPSTSGHCTFGMIHFRSTHYSQAQNYWHR